MNRLQHFATTFLRNNNCFTSPLKSQQNLIRSVKYNNSFLRYYSEARPNRNEEIRSRYIDLIGEDGSRLGVQPLRQVLAKMDKNLFMLVEVDSSSNPPFCKLFSKKAEYEKMKKKKGAKTAAVLVKEFKLSEGIGPHDVSVKINNGLKCINKGDIAKFIIKGKASNKNKISKEQQASLNLIQQAMEEVATVNEELFVDLGVATISFRASKSKSKLKQQSQPTASADSTYTQA